MMIRILFIAFIVAPFYLLQAQVSQKIALYYLLDDSASYKSFQNELAYFSAIDSVVKDKNFTLFFDKSSANYLLKYIKKTESWGFDIEKYQYTQLQTLFSSRNKTDKAKFQILAAEYYLHLYNDVLNGVLKTEEQRGKDIHLRLTKFNEYAVLSGLYNLSKEQLFQQAEPQEKAYVFLKKNLEKYYYQASDFYDEKIVFTDSLQIGNRDSAVLIIRKKLYFLGDLKTDRKFRSTIFDYDLKVALQQFQKRHLLESDGIVDEKTVEKLNIPIQEIITELQLNLERWRWLPQQLGTYYAFANLPAFEMSLVKNDSLILRQKIVCGKPSRNTPVFSDTMVYMDINPTWTVPPTILQNDILPAVKRSSTYLSRKNIKVLDLSTGKYISGAEINWANAKKYKFIQGPGFSNSLGVVKFIFPNPYYIFFHDTPHKEHFPLTSRAFSSGCVRLGQPLEFAEVLLQYNMEPIDSLAIDAILKKGKTKRILLDDQPLVYINYLTQEYKDGILYHYPDVYKYNKFLKEEFFQ